MRHQVVLEEHCHCFRWEQDVGRQGDLVPDLDLVLVVQVNLVELVDELLVDLAVDLAADLAVDLAGDLVVDLDVGSAVRQQVEHEVLEHFSRHCCQLADGFFPHLLH